MIILSVHNSADIYGGSRCLLRMMRLFAADGHVVHVVLPATGPLHPALHALGIHVHLLPVLAIVERPRLNTLRGKIEFLIRFPLSVAWLAALILRLHPGVVHTNTAVLPAPALAARLTGRRHIWHIREFFSEFPSIWKLYERYIGALSTTVVAISHAVEGQFTASVRRKSIVIHDGLDEAATIADPEAGRRFRAACGDPALLVGVVGRIKWVRKGQEILVEAASLLAMRFPHVRYVIAGSVSRGNEAHLLRLRELIRSRRLEAQFLFAGDIEDTAPLYAALDLTVVPSILPEPFGCVVMESMAAGTPVIGSRCGGIPEQIVDGVTGLLVTPGDPAALAEALATLIADEVLRARMSEAGILRYRTGFNMQTTYLRFLEIFEPGPRPAKSAIQNSGLSQEIRNRINAAGLQE